MHALQRLRHEARLLRVGLQFLTRWPVPPLATWDEAWLNDCVRHFPLIGAFVGALGAGVLLAGDALWSPGVAAVLAVAATALLTGAFHEDGLADTFDALGGSVPRERALEIMKDSRIGTYGALALGLVTLGRVALLASLVAVDAAQAAGALVLAHALGRGAPVALMASLRYAGDLAHAKARPLATAVRPRNLLVASVCSLLALGVAAWAGVAPGRLLAAALATMAVAALMHRWLQRRLGGYTGDTLGAAEQLTEVAVLLAFAARV